MQPHVNVQLFGILQQVGGAREREVTVDALPVSVADALASLVAAVPALGAHLAHTACAVGDEIVDRSTRLEAGDTLVLLPPVSGG